MIYNYRAEYCLSTKNVHNIDECQKHYFFLRIYLCDSIYMKSGT